MATYPKPQDLILEQTMFIITIRYHPNSYGHVTVLTPYVRSNEKFSLQLAGLYYHACDATQ